MAHDPDSRTLERFYMDLQSTSDLTGVTLGETTTLHSQTLIEENAPLALNILAPEAMRRTQGAVLNALVREIISHDECYPIGGSAMEQKLYKRRVSAAARRTLLDVEVRKQREAMTQLEF